MSKSKFIRDSDTELDGREWGKFLAWTRASGRTASEVEQRFNELVRAGNRNAVAAELKMPRPPRPTEGSLAEKLLVLPTTDVLVRRHRASAH